MSIFDLLFNDEAEFAVYIQDEADMEVFAKHITTDKLRYWFCRWSRCAIDEHLEACTSDTYKALLIYACSGNVTEQQYEWASKIVNTNNGYVDHIPEFKGKMLVAFEMGKIREGKAKEKEKR